MHPTDGGVATCIYGASVDVQRWWQWFQEQAGGGTRREMAARAMTDPSNLTRWSKGGTIDASTAIGVSRALGRSPLEALVAAGYLTSDEALLREVPASLDRFTDEQLLVELLRRHRVRREIGEVTETDDILSRLVRSDPAAGTAGALAARRGSSQAEARRRAQDAAAESPQRTNVD